MSNALDTLPGEHDFGDQFNYALWTAGTQVILCNVPWNMDYRDIVYFPTQNALDTYLSANAGPTVQIGSMTLAKPGNPVRVNLPFSACYKYNYLRVVNPAGPITGDVARSYYYFITDVRYIAPNTTEIQVQLDVWQTFCRDVHIGNCYIERGHIGIANEAQFDDNGRTYLTVPEGLDVGNEYVISNFYEHTLADNYAVSPTAYQIMLVTTVSLVPDPDKGYGTVSAPILNSARGSRLDDLPNGCEIYLMDQATFADLMDYLADKPWISQGFATIMAVPQVSGVSVSPVNVNSAITIQRLEAGRVPDQQIDLAPYFRDQIALGRYSRLQKFMTYPYTVIELTTYSGNPLLLKPECVPNDMLTIVVQMHLAPPNPRIGIVARGYNAKADINVWDGEYLDSMTGIFDLPTFSVVNNGYMSFMAANRNGIAYQHASADWSMQRALTGNQLGYDQASSGIALQNQLTAMGIGAANQSTDLANAVAGARALQRGGNALVGGALSAAGGNPVGGVRDIALGGANAAIDYGIASAQNSQQNAINNNLARSRNTASTGQSGYVRDTNKAYADYAAKGDYANTIAAINAKVQDAKLIQPTTSGQLGGDAFNLAVYKWGIFAKVKTLQPAIMATIGEFWLRYGYAINRFSRMPSDYQVMDTFTYWKLRETYITSSTCPESFRQSIRGIFEKGVTVWNSPEDIGNVDLAANQPLNGVTL